SWIYHAANGGVSAWIGWALTQDIQDQYRFLTEPRILIAAGLVGGLVYWLVAGWTAGFWKTAGSARRPAVPSLGGVGVQSEFPRCRATFCVVSRPDWSRLPRMFFALCPGTRGYRYKPDDDARM